MTHAMCMMMPHGHVAPRLVGTQTVFQSFTASSCGVLEVLTASLDLSSPECADAKRLGVYCGCPRQPNRCHLCHDHSSILYPNQTLDLLAADFGGQSPTCEIYESIVAQDLVEHTQECTIARGPAIECGCPSPFGENHCELCPGGIPKEFYDVPFELNKQVRCGIVETLETQMDENDPNCFLSQQGMHWCGCRGGVWNYAGVETETQQAVLAWAPRVTAFLSIVGSFCILLDIWKGRKKGSHKRMYHQLMIAISVADLFSSFMWLASTLPIPKYDENGSRLLIYGVQGNNATCVAQGFFFSLGASSVWFNVALSFYYKFVIVDGLKERAFSTKKRIMMLGIPALVGTIIACAGIGYYDWAPSGCGIRIVPWERHKKEFLGLVMIPGLTAIAMVTVVTCYVYYRFKKQLDVSDKWRFSSRAETLRASVSSGRRSSTALVVDGEGEANTDGPGQRLKEKIESCCLFSCFASWKKRLFETTLEGQVLRQSIFYLFAFYGFFPLSLVTSFLAAKHLIVLYPLSLVTVMLAPLQGFNNALVFFRPKLLVHLNKRKKRLDVLKRQRASNVDDDTSRRRFLRAHFFRGSQMESQGRSESNADPDRSGVVNDESSRVEVVENENENENDNFETRFGLEETVTVGSFRLPAPSGSQLWNTVRDDEEAASTRPPKMEPKVDSMVFANEAIDEESNGSS